MCVSVCVRERMCRVYMFSLLEMRDGVNQRIFSGIEDRVRFRMMKRDEEKMQLFCGGVGAAMKGVCPFNRIDGLRGVKFAGR